jgi:hypothetical protein
MSPPAIFFFSILASLVPKSGVKFTVAVQICPKIELLLPQFMQQSMNFDKSSFSLPVALTFELDAVSSLPRLQ